MISKSRVTKSLLLFFLTLSLTSCLAVNKLTVKSANGDISVVTAQQNQQNIQQEISAKEQKRELNLAVVPFAEKRGNLKSYGSVYTYLIPLVPYGTIRYERPDEAKMFNVQNEFEFEMSENMLKILVSAVRGSGLFGDVTLTPTPSASKADLVLSGDIYSTLYEGKTYSYGISFLGPALWCFGLPAGSSHKKLNIGFYLKKMDTQEVLWSYNLNKEKTVIQGLYHNWGRDVNTFANLMQEGVKEAIADLRLKLSKIPFDKLKVKSPEPAVSEQSESIPAQAGPSVLPSATNTTDATK
ncbi:MAG: hypothetical protein AAB456_00640 [Patescibacteria group bacterium]